MKMLKISKNTLLSLFIITCLSFSSNIYISCTVNDEMSVTKHQTANASNMSIQSNNVKEKKIHQKHKVPKRFKLKSEESKQETESEMIKNEEISQPQKQSDSILYVSWFIFIPLVLLIFIMTILSIAGFLILILNSTGGKTNNNTASINQMQGNNARSNLSRLSNSEIIEILRYKQQMRKKTKTNKSQYKPEPEPEGIVLTN